MQSPGSHGVRELHFPRRTPSGGSIRDQAADVHKASDHFDELEDSVGSEHRKARAGVHGEPGRDMKGAAKEPIENAHQMMLRATVSAGVLSLFARAVDDFNADVAQWNADMSAALADDDKDKAREIYDSHKSEYHNRPVIKDAADEAKHQLKNWDEDSTLRDLWEAGALPTGAKAMFPEVGLKDEHIDVEAGVDAMIDRLVSQGVLPPEATDWDADELQDYLTDNPEVADQLADREPDANAPGVESLLDD